VFGSATSQPPKGTGLRRTALRALTAATAALALSAAPGASGIAALPIHAWNIQPVITSLNEPRGLAFDAQANLTTCVMVSGDVRPRTRRGHPAMYVSTGSADTSPRSGAVLRVSH
jgi:hypothetical protein